MGPPAPPNSATIDPHVDHGIAVMSELDLGPVPGPDARPPYLTFNEAENFSHVAQTHSARTHVPESYSSYNFNPYSEPWDSQGIARGIKATLPLMNPAYAAAGRRLIQHDPAATPFYTAHSSEIDSSVNGRQQPDSGYETRSIYSGEALASNQDCHSLTGRLDQMALPQSQQQQQQFSEQDPFAINPQFTQDSQYANSTTPAIEVLHEMKCEISDCKHVSKNNSDAK